MVDRRWRGKTARLIAIAQANWPEIDYRFAERLGIPDAASLPVDRFCSLLERMLYDGADEDMTAKLDAELTVLEDGEDIGDPEAQAMVDDGSAYDLADAADQMRTVQQILDNPKAAGQLKKDLAARRRERAKRIAEERRSDG